jgi:hypothetical protein
MKASFAPTELRRIEGRHLDHRQMNLAVIVNQFRVQGVDEAPHGIFRTAVGACKGMSKQDLQRKQTIEERPVALKCLPKALR